jgi:superfamily II DNA/RNA helicase
VFPEGIPITTSSAGGYGSFDSTSVAPGLRHVYVESPSQHKVDAVRRVLHATEAKRALVSMNFQQRLKDAEGKLKAKKVSCASLHGEMTKDQRKNALANFRKGLRSTVVERTRASAKLQSENSESYLRTPGRTREIRPCDNRSS